MTNECSGSCLCGAVRFRTKGSLRGVVYCHCSQCRKQTGLYYAATDVDVSNVMLEGEDQLTWYAASDFARRGFCKTCGSALFWRRLGADKISILAGAFDLPSGLTAESHIFVADKGDFYDIADGLPQYQRGSPGVIVAEEREQE
ncbi:GFA family protein [Nitratireductor sp. B36]|uniref:GFA family protein n=1 Tax=Nitratireductor sp. B36 TaxID=2762059 RepID=UPI001E36D39F|nr:GFA family protein [Nitratireductor sp. B36]MCC5779626.1 GFA family protein [Nitratireductor sp. B36]